MAYFSISDDTEGVRVISYSASSPARAKATTLTVKIEVSDHFRLGMLLSDLSELHHPNAKPNKRKKRLALPAPDDAELE